MQAAAPDVHSASQSQSAVPSPRVTDTGYQALQGRFASSYLSDSRSQPA
jgi:hypothetical protein